MHTEKHTSKVEKNKQTKPTLYYDCIQKKKIVYKNYIHLVKYFKKNDIFDKDY